MPAPHSADSRGGWAHNRRRHSAHWPWRPPPVGLRGCLVGWLFSLRQAAGSGLPDHSALGLLVGCPDPAREDCLSGVVPGPPVGRRYRGADASASRDKRPGVLQLEPLDGPQPDAARDASTSPEAAGVGRQASAPPRAVRTGWLDILLMSAGRKCRKIRR